MRPSRPDFRWSSRPSTMLGGRAMEIVRDEEQFHRYIPPGGEGVERGPGVDRSVPLAGHRSGRRRPVRRRRRVRGRRTGAHRGGRRAFGRQRLLPAAVFPARRDHRRAQGADAGHGRGPGSARTDECPVRHRGAAERCAADLRPGGQSAGQPHGALRGQDHRPAGGGDRRQDHGRGEARRLQSDRRQPCACGGQGGGVRVRALPGVDTVLGPEMRSTGEVMGLDWRRPGEGPGPAFARAFAKSQLAGGVVLPGAGGVFVSVKDSDKPRASSNRCGC